MIKVCVSTFFWTVLLFELFCVSVSIFEEAPQLPLVCSCCCSCYVDWRASFHFSLTLHTFPRRYACCACLLISLLHTQLNSVNNTFPSFEQYCNYAPSNSFHPCRLRSPRALHSCSVHFAETRSLSCSVRQVPW